MACDNNGPEATAVRSGACRFSILTAGPRGPGRAGYGEIAKHRTAGPCPAPARPAPAAAARSRPVPRVPVSWSAEACAPPRTPPAWSGGRARPSRSGHARGRRTSPESGPREHSPQGLQGVQYVPLHASFGPQLWPSHGRLTQNCSSL